MALKDRSWVLIAERQVVEELPEITQGIMSGILSYF